MQELAKIGKLSLKNDFVTKNFSAVDPELLKKLNLPVPSMVDIGTYSTSYMNKVASEIFAYYAPINAISWFARAESEKIKEYCSKFFLDLTGGSITKNYQYFTTSGSSEAIFLAVFLWKKHWQSMYGRKIEKLNLVIGSNAHAAWFKAANYLDIDTQILPINEELLSMDLAKLSTLINDRTIGINCTLGAPTTLLFDQVQKCNSILEEYYQNCKQFIPIHVDAASGGFIAPFVYNNLEWDFNLKHVLSINLSSHKYGLVYPSLGWLLLDKQLYSEGLNHENNYLGEPIKTFALHFSHSVAHLFTQYYYIQEFGLDGYTAIITGLFDLVNKMKCDLMQLEEIEIIAPAGSYNLPGILFKLNPLKTKLKMKEFSLALRAKGWKFPTYTLPYPLEKQEVGRVVMRYGFTEELIAVLGHDIKECLATSKISLIKHKVI